MNAIDGNLYILKYIPEVGNFLQCTSYDETRDETRYGYVHKTDINIHNPYLCIGLCRVHVHHINTLHQPQKHGDRVDGQSNGPILQQIHGKSSAGKK